MYHFGHVFYNWNECRLVRWLIPRVNVTNHNIQARYWNISALSFLNLLHLDDCKLSNCKFVSCHRVINVLPVFFFLLFDSHTFI